MKLTVKQASEVDRFRRYVEMLREDAEQCYAGQRDMTVSRMMVDAFQKFEALIKHSTLETLVQVVSPEEKQ